MTRARIKICGIRDPRMAEVAVDAGADAIGVVLAEGSPRRVDFETALEIARSVPAETAVVAVVTREEPRTGRIAQWPGVIQVHGPWVDDETEAIGAMTARRPVIRGLPWSTEAVLAADAAPHVAALLVDGPAGGGGRPFDHEALVPLMPRLWKPVIVAGGLRPETVAAVVAKLRPYGVDVSSGVESSPGVKDAGAIRAFCAAVSGASGAPACESPASER